MDTKLAEGIPATLPVEFTERIIYLMVDVLGMWPQLGAIVAFGARLDELRLARALYLLTIAEPVLGCRFVAEGAPPVWRRIDGLAPEVLLQVRIADDAIAAGEAFVVEEFDIGAQPQVLGAIIRGREGDVLALKLSHVAVDGGALKEALYLLGNIYRQLADEPGWMPEPNLEGLRGPRAKAGPFETLRALSKSKMEMPPSDWKIPLDDGRGDAGYVGAVVEPEVFRRAAELGKQMGATVNDLFLTAYFRTLWRLLEAEEGARTPCQVSCELRKHLPAGTKTALANISNAWTVSVGPRRDEDFGETLLRVVSQTSAWKRGGAAREQAIAIPLANKVMRRQGLEKMRAMFAKGALGSLEEAWRPTVTNIGAIDDARLDFDVPVLDAWLLGPISMAGAALTASTFRDRFHLSVGAEFAALDRSLVSGMATGTAAEIEGWGTSRLSRADEMKEAANS